ncbi:TatD DNase family protein [Formivibrio citricus]|uniref:TatD DNase family protein n=2 Tax=Formivibrio citricus TaxID=83765 RepID=A0A1I4XDI8_9NEIS|nr:TatD DNase family protein [Formivibrio citricus]
MMFVDSHCHLNFPDLAANLDLHLAQMEANGVTHALCVGVDLENLPQVLALAEEHENLFASVGVHPSHDEGEEPTLERLLALSQWEKVVAIGETGLDYYWHKDQPEWQRERFRTHIRAAKQAGLPLIVHTRESAADTLLILREENAAEVGGVMHCFTESWAVAEQSLEMGFYLSFSGVVTFKSAVELKEVAKRVPLDRLLIETDAPYLAPVPFRGKLNHPALVRHVAECIADLRGVPLHEIAAASTENFFRLFKRARQG